MKEGGQVVRQRTPDTPSTVVPTGVTAPVLEEAAVEHHTGIVDIAVAVAVEDMAAGVVGGSLDLAIRIQVAGVESVVGRS
jgi:hypothetical protein